VRARDLHDVRSPQSYLLRVASHVVAEWRDRQPPEEMFEPVDEEFLPMREVRNSSSKPKCPRRAWSKRSSRFHP